MDSRCTRLAAAAVFALVLTTAACSPEAGRGRGGTGGDTRNRPDAPSAVEFHGKTNSAHDVPLVGEAVRK